MIRFFFLGFDSLIREAGFYRDIIIDKCCIYIYLYFQINLSLKVGWGELERSLE